ncbi:hypothetical protein ACFC26_41250 [Kitasatospora purpeofusca]|uniref:hypothetical protein n=1 Tax=Kitasatospora purpeofusca TaxID=67352 RepID=UPI0035DA017F
MSDQQSSGAQGATQPQTATTAQLQDAAHQLQQQVQSHVGSSTPSPASGETAQQR